MDALKDALRNSATVLTARMEELDAQWIKVQDKDKVNEETIEIYTTAKTTLEAELVTIDALLEKLDEMDGEHIIWNEAELNLEQIFALGNKILGENNSVAVDTNISMAILDRISRGLPYNEEMLTDEEFLNAVWAGDYNFIALMLTFPDFGTELDLEGIFYSVAVKRGNVALADVFLNDRFKRVDPSSFMGYRSLDFAIEVGDTAMVNRLLMDERVNPSVTLDKLPGTENTLLFKAVSQGRTEIVRMMLNNPRFRIRNPQAFKQSLTSASKLIILQDDRRRARDEAVAIVKEKVGIEGSPVYAGGSRRTRKTRKQRKHLKRSRKNRRL